MYSERKLDSRDGGNRNTGGERRPFFSFFLRLTGILTAMAKRRRMKKAWKLGMEEGKTAKCTKSPGGGIHLIGQRAGGRERQDKARRDVVWETAGLGWV